MTETCYRCGKPATYFCDATGCGHHMCGEHSVLTILGTPEPGEESAAGAASHAAAPDHAHYCLDHAPSAQP